MTTSFKIAVCGPHGAGKTTLVNRIAEILSPPPHLHWTIVPDLARQCPYPIGSRSDSVAQQWILDRRSEVDAQQGAIISDGCLLTDCAYYEHWSGNKPTEATKAIQFAATYDVIVRVPADPRLCLQDDKRPSDLKFLEKISILIDDWMQLLPKPQIMLPKFDQYDRDTFIRTTLVALRDHEVMKEDHSN